MITSRAAVGQAGHKKTVLGKKKRTSRSQKNRFGKEKISKTGIMTKRETREDSVGEKNSIKWEESEAKFIVLEHLVQGILPLDSKEMPPKQAWETYRDLDDFKDVSYVQFRTNLNKYRKYVKSEPMKFHFHAFLKSKREEDAFIHDMKLFPKEKRNDADFDLYVLLREDVENGKHLELTPLQLRKTRKEYMEVDQAYFRKKFSHAVRRKTFFNWLNEQPL